MQSETSLQVGTVVRLNSGSPDMKVVAPQAEAVHVEWAADDGTVQFGMFPITSLVRARTT